MALPSRPKAGASPLHKDSSRSSTADGAHLLNYFFARENGQVRLCGHNYTNLLLNGKGGRYRSNPAMLYLSGKTP